MENEKINIYTLSKLELSVLFYPFNSYSDFSNIIFNNNYFTYLCFICIITSIL